MADSDELSFCDTIALEVSGRGLKRFMTSRFPVAVADQVRALLRITDELESVSDEMPVIVKVCRRIRAYIGTKLESGLHAVILCLLDRLSCFTASVNISFRFCETLMGANASKLSADIRKCVREARQSTLLTVGSDEPAPLRALAQLDILNASKQIPKRRRSDSPRREGEDPRHDGR